MEQTHFAVFTVQKLFTLNGKYRAMNFSMHMPASNTEE